MYVFSGKHVHVFQKTRTSFSKNMYVFPKKDVRVFLKAYNDRGDSLKQAITHILMKEKDVCNELRSIFATSNITQ